MRRILAALSLLAALAASAVGQIVSVPHRGGTHRPLGVIPARQPPSSPGLLLKKSHGVAAATAHARAPLPGGGVRSLVSSVGVKPTARVAVDPRVRAKEREEHLAEVRAAAAEEDAERKEKAEEAQWTASHGAIERALAGARHSDAAAAAPHPRPPHAAPRLGANASQAVNASQRALATAPRRRPVRKAAPRVAAPGAVEAAADAVDTPQAEAAFDAEHTAMEAELTKLDPRQEAKKAAEAKELMREEHKHRLNGDPVVAKPAAKPATKPAAAAADDDLDEDGPADTFSTLNKEYNASHHARPKH